MLTQIYGLTTVEDARAVDGLGADRIGVVVDEGIPTWDSVDEAAARAIADTVRSAQLVALSLSTDPDRIGHTAELIRPAALHLARAHLMDPGVLEELRGTFAGELMLTVPVSGPESLDTASRLARLADTLLLDTAHPATGVVGATGLTHDWALSAEIVRSVEVPVILAGGLGPENVRQAIALVRPSGVDSETRTSRDDDRRRKDLDKVRLFIEAARAPLSTPGSS